MTVDDGVYASKTGRHQCGAAAKEIGAGDCDASAMMAAVGLDVSNAARHTVTNAISQNHFGVEFTGKDDHVARLRWNNSADHGHNELHRGVRLGQQLSQGTTDGHLLDIRPASTEPAATNDDPSSVLAIVRRDGEDLAVDPNIVSSLGHGTGVGGDNDVADARARIGTDNDFVVRSCDHAGRRAVQGHDHRRSAAQHVDARNGHQRTGHAGSGLDRVDSATHEVRPGSNRGHHSTTVRSDDDVARHSLVGVKVICDAEDDVAAGLWRNGNWDRSERDRH